LDVLRRSHDLHLTIVDDNSGDGTEETVQRLNLPGSVLIVRTSDADLSSAVLEGLNRTSGDIIVVMDGISATLRRRFRECWMKLAKESDFVVDPLRGGWRHGRQLGHVPLANSRAATLLARPFTSSRIYERLFRPQAGHYSKADFLNPIGYKIGLELLSSAAAGRFGSADAFADRITD